MAYTYDSNTNSFSGTSQNIKLLGQVMWHITDKCLLNCAICFTKGMRIHHTEVPFEDIQSCVLLLKKLGVQKIDISGGEPLLYAHLPFLVEQCVLQSIAVTITTSGMGSIENAEWVAKHHHLFSRVIVSLDGPKDVHNKLRGSDHAYWGVDRFCSLLHRYKAPNVRINTVLTKECIALTVCDELCKLICTICPREWCLIEPFPINKTDAFASLTVEKSEYEEFYARSILLIKESKIQIIRRVNVDYGSYWALYPDGYLYYSHDNNNYDTKILLSEDYFHEITNSVKKTRQTYIKIVKEDTKYGNQRSPSDSESK